jgi:hypothetical protein
LINNRKSFMTYSSLRVLVIGQRAD